MLAGAEPADRTSKSKATRERAARAAVMAVLAVAFLLDGLAVPALALRWWQRPPAERAASRFEDFFVPYLVSLAYLLIGLWVYRLRQHEVTGRVFALFCAAAAVALGGLFDLSTTHGIVWAWTLAAPAVGASMITLALMFPEEAAVPRRRPWLRWASFVPALVIWAYALFASYRPAPGSFADLVAPLYAVSYAGAGLLVFTGVVLYRWLYSGSPIVREQSSAILLGSAAAFGLVLVWAARWLAGDASPFDTALYLPPLVLFPAAIAYAMLRYRLLETDMLLGQALVYTGAAAVTIAGYALILTGLSLIAGSALEANHPLALGLVVFLLVAGFNPLRERLQALVNDIFFRGTRAYSQRLETFGRALTRAEALGDILAALNEHIEGALRPAHAHLFLRDPITHDFGAYVENGGAESVTDVRFPADSALAQTLARERAVLYLTPDTPMPSSLERDRARLAMVGSAVYAPLAGKAGLAGWLAIGPRLSGGPLARADLRFIEALADQAALAIERATAIDDLERRVRELNILSHMSQAVNFTIAYDDLLELIYAQASKVVDTRNFFIVLKNARGSGYSYALYVEADERLTVEENKLWAGGRGLSAEVLRTGQPIRTDDYLAECRRRNLTPRDPPFRTWMGVPLNAGAESIGVMNVASYEANGNFTAEQLNVFRAIADQAASAIVKARLYDQTERRARQLATLNEVSASMAANLDLDRLLERIIELSMGILDCEAGSLFLTDEETGESVFRVAAGPVGQNLIGMRIAPGKGFVGEAVESGAALVVNDVQNDPRWFRGSDQTTGFVTRALMVVPLRRGDRRVGAIEVINKRDGTPFDDEDQTLLTAFAGQAAVAIENARLFAQTDQALAARVEELSVMQRIDRELNTALDVQRVMDLTLAWAMKNTNASAGSVGIVGEGGINVIATRGYGDTVEQLRDRPLPLDRGIMGRVARTGQVSLVRDVRADPDYQGVLASTQAQLTIPILREGRVVGLLNLESADSEAFSPEQVEFATRLLDHASIAITNARLYAEVHAANIAKSEFVSVAAHELKTPMTAIKMSAELLVSGAVGAINDTQKQFLGTVRNNLDRMATIVSDLNDVTRIETGRMRLDLKAVPFQSVVDEVLRTTRQLLEAKSQALLLDIPPDLPNVWADPNRATQVLTNLLSNAHKYTPDGGRVALRVVVESAAHDNGGSAMLHVAVQDTGIGITPEDQQKLFTKFFRSEDRAAREMATGTGLGLNIVKNLVELQGGKIWLESEFRKGSTFHFTLPLSADGTTAGPGVPHADAGRVEGGLAHAGKGPAA